MAQGSAAGLTRKLLDNLKKKEFRDYIMRLILN